MELQQDLHHQRQHLVLQDLKCLQLQILMAHQTVVLVWVHQLPFRNLKAWVLHPLQEVLFDLLWEWVHLVQCEQDLHQQPHHKCHPGQMFHPCPVVHLCPQDFNSHPYLVMGLNNSLQCSVDLRSGILQCLEDLVGLQ
jgi:hypothetical protein